MESRLRKINLLDFLIMDKFHSHFDYKAGVSAKENAAKKGG